MKTKNQLDNGTDRPKDMLNVNKQIFIDAALELERQETFQCLTLMECARQLEGIAQKIEGLLSDSQAIRARGDLLNLFLPDKEWNDIINNDRVAEWEAEFKDRRRS
jgi:hypothetical protein